MNKIFYAFLFFPGLAFSSETVMTGDSMDLYNRGEKVVFTGNVRLERGFDSLEADKMQTNKTRDKMQAWGRVHFKRIISSTETLVGYGDEGTYETGGGAGVLIGAKKQANMIYSHVDASSQTHTVDMVADRFEFSRVKETMSGQGRVYGKSLDPETGDFYEFWAERVDYDGVKRVMVLTGKTQPKVRQQTVDEIRTITGDVITSFLEDNDFEARGQAQAVFAGKP